MRPCHQKIRENTVGKKLLNVPAFPGVVGCGNWARRDVAWRGIKGRGEKYHVIFCSLCTRAMNEYRIVPNLRPGAPFKLE